jgi:hypothetical protein
MTMPILFYGIASWVVQSSTWQLRSANGCNKIDGIGNEGVRIELGIGFRQERKLEKCQESSLCSSGTPGLLT